jgi:mannosyltransferase
VSPEVIVTNLKKRYTGVSGTISALMPVQSRELNIGFVGRMLPGAVQAQAERPDHFTRLGLWSAIRTSRKRLPDGRRRIWHVRRNHEMLLGILLRDLFRCPIRLVFTSAAQHTHTWGPTWLVSRMDAVIATTPKAGSLVPNTRAVVHHGAALSRFTPPVDKSTAWETSKLPGRFGIGLFGRIRPTKGTDIFVDAMLEALPKDPDFTAIITGDCLPRDRAYKARLVAKIQAHGLTDRIIFLGDLKPEEIPHWYRRVLIAVASPRYEPFGITPLEAMACGCAVVASDTGAFSIIVEEGVTGHIVPTGDPVRLAERVEALMQDPERALEMGQLGRKRVLEHFSVEKEAAGIRSVYESVWQSDQPARAQAATPQS